MGHFNDQYYCDKCGTFTNSIFKLADSQYCDRCINKLAKNSVNKKPPKKSS